VGAATSEQEELVVNVAELHACSRRGRFSNDLNLRPYEHLEVENEKIIKSLGAIPPSENVEVVLDNA